MKRKLYKWPLLILILLMMLPISSTIFNLEPTQKQPFDIQNLAPDLSISQALELYPEITDIFYIKKVSDEEAKERIAKGELVKHLDESVFARELLQSLNARKSVE